MTGVVVIVIIVSVTVSAYVAAVVPGHIVAITAVVAGAVPPAALIIVLPIVGRMCAAGADAATAATADSAAMYNIKHSTARAGAIR